jgi:hypothetical protein
MFNTSSEVTNSVSSFFEKLVIAQLLNKFSSFYRTQRSITMLTEAFTGPYPESDNSSYTGIVYAGPASFPWKMDFEVSAFEMVGNNQ